MHLRAAAFEGLQVVGFGRTGSPSAAVSAGPAAEKDYDIPRFGAFPANILCRSRADYGADFHVLGNIALMVDLVHLTGCEPNLISVGGIACRRCRHQLSLGEFSR